MEGFSRADSAAMKSSRAWASLDNETSFWMTKPSLLNLLRDVGFTTVCEVFRPASFFDFSDRLTLAAIKEFRNKSQYALKLQNQIGLSI